MYIHIHVYTCMYMYMYMYIVYTVHVLSLVFGIYGGFIALSL